MNAESAFFENIDRAKNILNVVEIKEEIEPLKKCLLFPRQRPIVTMIRKINPEGRIATILGLVDETVEIAVPLLLIFSVSCLEHYLKQVNPEEKKLVEMIDHWKADVGTSLIHDVHEIRKKRNKIVHSPEWKAQLNVEQVKKDLDKLRSFVEAISRTTSDPPSKNRMR